MKLRQGTFSFLPDLNAYGSHRFNYGRSINPITNIIETLEESNNKIIMSLPPGSALLANNYFWLHGRKPFKENKNLIRELLRIRGYFFTN